MKKRKLIILITLITIFSLIITVLIMNILKDPQAFISKDHNSNIVNVLSYIGLSIIQILLPLIPGEPVQLLSGYLFGKVNGTIICLICESIGSIIVILLTRKLKDKFTSLYYDENKFKKIDKFKSKKYFTLFSLIFIMPGTPKDLLCYFSGITEYDIVPLLIITTIGRIPSIASSTIVAGLLKERKFLISIIIYLITVIICFIDLLIYKQIIKNKENN